jgi:hypothetical protein
MTTTRSLLSIPALLAASALAACGGSHSDSTQAAKPAAAGPAALPHFSNPRRIDNPYLPLTKFRRCELRGPSEGKPERVVRTLLPTTERFTVGGAPVDAAVVEDTAHLAGTLSERTFDYFAQADDGTVYYLGERVNTYRGGKLTGHEGTWLYGKDTQSLGVAMAADPRTGATWRGEDVPGVTTEADRVMGHDASASALGHTYPDAIRVRESIKPENEVEDKVYARGIGPISEVPPDGRSDLVDCR